MARRPVRRRSPEPEPETVYEVRSKAALRAMRSGQKAQALLTRLFEELGRLIRDVHKA